MVRTGFQACVFALRPEDCTPYMESDVTQSAIFYKSWAWAEAHKKQLLLGTVSVLVVGFAAGFFIWREGEKEVSASQALTKIAVQSTAAGQAAAPEAYVKIASEYPKTAAAARALLVAGARYFADAKYPEAQAQFQRFLSEYPSSDFSGQAVLGIAACLEAQGKTPEAIKAYKDIAERRSSDAVAPQARLSLGRLYVAQGNLSQAKETYEQLARSDSGEMSREAGMLLQELLTKNPSLVQPAPAPANASAPKLK